MPLAVGTRLGPYEILSAVGAGGMGEVYRARDTKLKRDVALKILPESFAADPDRLARSQREAEVLASLNHPHIAAIYGIEEGEGVRALVLELVEGETLADRIARGPIPIDEALPIAKQIAEALEAAHEQGIIHRDLKPANIKVRPDGTVKLLDFGLAKLNDPNVPNGPNVPNALSMSPTITSPAMMTGVGVLLGTAAYMAPEQARGKVADKRADIWAYGCVLYEMLTGKRAFHGDDVTDTIVAVVSKEPDWAALPASTRSSIRQLLRRTLQKDLKRRVPDIAVARFEIDEAMSGPAEEAEGAAISSPPKASLRQRAFAAASGAIAVALAVAWSASVWRGPSSVPPPALRFTVSLGEAAALQGNVPFALSPDGTKLVTQTRRSDQRMQLVIRALDGTDPRPLAGGDARDNGVQDAFFSPDGQWVGFLSEGKLKKAPVQGGASVALCDVMNPRGASWGSDGFIVVAADRLGGLSRCPADGGALEPLTKVGPGESSHRWPQALPEANAVLFTSTVIGNAPDANSIVVQSLKSGQRKTIWKGGTYGRYLPTGHLVFVSQNTLFAVRMDIARLELIGTPQPIVRGVATSPGSDSALYDVSPTGTLVFATELPATRSAIGRLDAAGQVRPLVPGEGGFRTFRFSPDGRRAAFVGVADGVWIYDFERDSRSRLTANGINHGIWTRDGRYILFVSRGASRDGISVARADGSGEDVSLLDQRGPLAGLAVSPDGTRLAFGETSGSDSGTDLWTLPVDFTGNVPRTTGEPQVYLRTSSNEAFPRISPDGRWLAYQSDESGQPEAYVRPFPGPGGKWQISTDGEQDGLVWSRDGREIVYRNLKGQLMAVAYTASNSTFTAGKPRLVSPTAIQGSLADIAPDGKSFAVITAGANATAPEVTFVVNFFDEVRRRLAAEK
jgi:serine/threonine-protein kinase